MSNNVIQDFSAQPPILILNYYGHGDVSNCMIVRSVEYCYWVVSGVLMLLSCPLYLTFIVLDVFAAYWISPVSHLLFIFDVLVSVCNVFMCGKVLHLHF